MIDLRLGECIEQMKTLGDGSIDLVLCDLPYGLTACRWDQIIPFEPLWAHYKRLLKPHGAVVLTASQPFTSMLVMSNPKWFRYSLVWDKQAATGHLDAKRKPLRYHEDILVFAKGRTTYNPQKWKGTPSHSHREKPGSRCQIYGTYRQVKKDVSGMKYPKSILSFGKNAGVERLHPSQKPVALMEYLIKTYSNEGDTVLDNAMGSGTTGLACLNTGRHFIGIESDPAYFAIAERRLAAASNQTPLFAG